MHPYLTRLGIRPEVQRFFRPFYRSDTLGNLVFPYGNESELFGLAFHRVPVTDSLWLAGNLHFPQVRLVILSASALDAVSWLNKKAAFLPVFDGLLFIATGSGISEGQLKWLRDHLRNKKCCLIYSRDLLGGVADVKLAAVIRGLPLVVWFADGRVVVSFRFRAFSFSPDSFGLNAFEKASGFRFGVGTEKPKDHVTFFDELKAGAFVNF